MALSAGTRLGPYEIQAAIGAGGMGEVHRARDTKLNRDVALKVLPDSFAQDVERLARFKREAQVLASLNHPNIGAIYGLEDSAGVPALVLELVEGPTLADRIEEGSLPLDEALPVATQIAAALEAAHEQGVIHRDLKPANVKVRADGSVKVLDFGLAKAMSGEPSAMPLSSENSPTFTSPARTALGVILGTAAYMAPEQARGKTIDRRVDIWAFGCVLFEMVTGQRPFGGETVLDTVSAVVSREPDWAALPGNVPPGVVQLLRHCLQKDPRKRLRDIADARLMLEAPQEIDQTAPATVTRTPRFGFLGWMIPAMVGGVLVAAMWIYQSLLRPPPQRQSGIVTRFDVQPPDAASGLTLLWRPSVAVSANGQAIAFVAATGGVNHLYVRTRSDPSVSMVPGSDHATGPELSPDGASVAFWFRSDKIRGIRTGRIGAGFTVVVPANDAHGLSWTDDGMLVFTPDGASSLLVMPAGGGQIRPLTTLAAGERTHRWPQALPGGKAVLFTVGTDSSPQSMMPPPSRRSSRPPANGG